MLADDGVGRRGPAEGLRVGVVGVEVGPDVLVQLDDGAEHAALEAPLRQRGEQTLNGVDPGGRGRREVDVEARMPDQPAFHRLGLVGGVVVEDQVQVEVGRGLPVDQPQEADELGGTMAEHALTDDGARLHVERGEQRRRAMPLVVVGHGRTPAALHRQPQLGAVEGLDLALLVHGQHQGSLGRVDVEPDDVADLLDELRVVRELEGLNPVRLQAVPAPDAMDGGRRCAST